MRALAHSIPRILSLVVLTAMLMYVYAMVGWILFGDQDPENWGNIGEALLSTFTMLTLENWPHQHPDRDDHQLDGGGPRGRAAGLRAERLGYLDAGDGDTVTRRRAAAHACS